MPKYFRTNIDIKVGDYVKCNWSGYDWVSPVRGVSTSNYDFPVTVDVPSVLSGTTIALSVGEIKPMSDDEAVEYLLSKA